MSHPIQTCFRRYEKKYLLTRRQQAQLLAGMAPYVVPDRYGQYGICSIYYDTPDWRLTRASMEKPLYKEKLRVRSYGVPGEDGPVFVELKKKFDGVVYKRRITAEACAVDPFLHGLLPPDRFGQIGREIGWFQAVNRTEPRVFIGYHRLAYAGRQDPDLRITFDTDLRWRTDRLDLCLGDQGSALLPPDRVLMELKLPGACPLWLSSLLDRAGAFPTSFSKLGTCYKQFILPKEAVFCA